MEAKKKKKLSAWITPEVWNEFKTFRTARGMNNDGAIMALLEIAKAKAKEAK